MRNLAVAMVMLGVALSPAQAQGGRWETLVLARLMPVHILGSYAGREATVAQYAVAMRRYKAAGERGPGDRLAISAFVPLGAPPALEPFTWVSADGSMVRRVGDGMFAVSVGNQLGNWYVDVKCQVVLWPTLACSDGIDRKAAAPDLETFVLDGIEFKRPYPKAEIPSEEELATIPLEELR